MPEIPHYSHMTVADVPEKAWPQAMMSFLSWGGYLQALPGYLAMRFGAVRREDEHVRIYVTTNWEYREQLAEWVSGPWTPRRILSDLSEPGEVVMEEVFEDFV